MPRKYHHKKKVQPKLLPDEIWEDVVGYEGLYWVSNMGRIKFRNGQISYGGGKKGDYKRIVLQSLNGKKEYKRIHQLVAVAFIPNIENKPEVNHKFGDKQDNRASSLEWATRIENNDHAIKTGLKKEFYRKFPDEVVLKIRASSLSNAELSKIYGIDYRYIWSMRKGLARTKI